jgi:UDP-2,3-diacylglucosamine pyrophosphatase LpxH
VKGQSKKLQVNGAHKQKKYLNSYLIKHTSTQNSSKVSKEGHFILIKGTVHKLCITIVNICTLNINTPNFIRQTLMDIITDRSQTKLVCDFNIPLSLIGM